MACDPYFDQVVLLLHFNGGMTDSSKYAHTVTAVGNGVVSGGTVKYGSGAFSLPDTSTTNGTQWTVSFAAGSELDILPVGDFTIEFWLYPVGNPVNNAVEMSYGCDMATENDGVIIEVGSDTAVSGLCKVSPGIGSTVGAVGGSGTTVAGDAWHFVAFCRKGSNAAIWLDGTRVGSYTTAYDASNFTTGGTRTFQMGLIAGGSGGVQASFVDEVRVTKGVARYDPTSSSMTIPSAAFGGTCGMTWFWILE